MFSRSIPMYGDKPEDKPVYDDSKDANIVGRFDDFEEDEIIVRR
nr:MAG TPA: hypothetical protein [Caudoviricetes sp.]